MSYLNGLVVFPAFLNLSLNLAIGICDLSHSQFPSYFADCIELLHHGCGKYNQSDFCIDHLMTSMCRDFSCVVGSGCLV